MDANTLQVLQNLQPGSDAQFFSDAVAVQAGKSGLTIAAILTATASVYYLLCSLGVFGSSKRSVFAIIVTVIAGIGAFLLNQKAETFRVIDDSRPIIALNATKLEYDVRRNGWIIPWTYVTSVELKTTTTHKKQSVEQTTYEIRVNTKLAPPITWKYEPSADNDVETVQKLVQSENYLVIDPEPLGIDAAELQKALEKYRQGL